MKLLISAYKPIKRLTLDWRQVAFAVEQHSSLLEVNPEGTKVRRIAELPPPTEEAPCCNSRTVVATTFPVSSPSIRDVVNVFSVCGDIIQVRVLRPGNPTSGGVRKYLAAHPHLQQKVCAFVEFERVESAERAVRELPVSSGGLQVEHNSSLMRMFGVAIESELIISCGSGVGVCRAWRWSGEEEEQPSWKNHWLDRCTCCTSNSSRSDW